jgi:hypothetical protein
MEEVKTAGFWSYAHEDDRLDDGGILNLADKLRNEFALLASRELSLFVDRKGIEWGDEWRPTIDGALARTSFFFPILTPRYFERPECRREFIDFHGAALSLGSLELILPILYAPISQFDETNSNELIVLASRFQYVDWSELRLEDPSSTLVKKQIHALAKRLIEVAKRIEAAQVDREIAIASDGGEAGGAGGALDLIEEISKLLPAWTISVETGVVGYEQGQATLALYVPRLSKLEKNRGNSGAKFALTQRLAVQILPVMRTKRETAQAYARKSLELDPLMNELLQVLEREPALWDLVQVVDEAMAEAKEPLGKWIYQEANHVDTLGKWAGRRAHVSRVVREVAETAQQADALAAEGNEIAVRWMNQWEKLTAQRAAATEDERDEDVEGAALDA